MSVQMFDTVTPADVPADAQAVAFYIDGNYAVTEDIWTAHPGALRAEIATNINTQRGTVLDCEPGNCTPAQTPYWVRHRQAAGVKMPVIYCSLSAMGEVLSYNHQAGLFPGIWAAEWTGQDHTIPGTVGCQWANPTRLPAQYQGKNLDLSTITDESWLLPALGAVQAPPAATTVPFPLPAGDWYGRPSPNPHNHSGYFWAGDQLGIREIQSRLAIQADGLYGNQTFAHVVAFQRDAGVNADGLVGPVTWGHLF